MPTPASPLRLSRGPAWRNRMVLAPLTNKQSNLDGSLSDDEYNWLMKRAEGGFGVVMTCAAHVSQQGQAFARQLALWDDKFLPGLSRLAAGLEARGVTSSVQLHHGGLRAKARPPGTPLVSAWTDHERGVRSLTTAEIGDVIKDFADAAQRVERAGFRGVEIHGAHGYLLAQFLDGSHNRRRDGFGGSLVNRTRILFGVLTAVREATGPDFQVGIRLSPHRFGVVLDEALVVAEAVMTSGLIDYLDMSLWDAQDPSPDPGHEGRSLTQVFADLPRGNARLGVAGKITSGEAAQRCLDWGADFVLIGTGAILQHDFASRLAADPAFTSVPQPVSREHLEKQGLGQQFIDYLAEDWDDFVL